MSTAEHREEARMMGVRKKWEVVLRAVHSLCTYCPYCLELVKFVQSPYFVRRMDGIFLKNCLRCTVKTI